MNVLQLVLLDVLLEETLYLLVLLTKYLYVRVINSLHLLQLDFLVMDFHLVLGYTFDQLLFPLEILLYIRSLVNLGFVLYVIHLLDDDFLDLLQLGDLQISLPQCVLAFDQFKDVELLILVHLWYVCLVQIC